MRASLCTLLWPSLDLWERLQSQDFLETVWSKKDPFLHFVRLPGHDLRPGSFAKQKKCLQVVREIARLHSAKVSVESQKGAA